MLDIEKILLGIQSSVFIKSFPKDKDVVYLLGYKLIGMACIHSVRCTNSLKVISLKLYHGSSKIYG